MVRKAYRYIDIFCVFWGVFVVVFFSIKHKFIAELQKLLQSTFSTFRRAIVSINFSVGISLVVFNGFCALWMFTPEAYHIAAVVLRTVAVVVGHRTAAVVVLRIAAAVLRTVVVAVVGLRTAVAAAVEH